MNFSKVGLIIGCILIKYPHFRKTTLFCNRYVYFNFSTHVAGTGAAGNNRIYFKVADGVEDTDEIMNYYITGMSLPMGRLSYEYKFTVE